MRTSPLTDRVLPEMCLEFPKDEDLPPPPLPTLAICLELLTAIYNAGAGRGVTK